MNDIFAEAREFLNDADIPEKDQFEDFIDKAEDGDPYYKESLEEFMNRVEEGQNPFIINGFYTLLSIYEECEETNCE